MLYIIFTTGRCNLKCKYCGGSFSPERVPWKPKYSADDLIRFLSGDPDPIIAFYGGEPLINVDLIVEVMDRLPDARFVIQSNATLTWRLKPEYWLKFNAVLLSIDGRMEVTDFYRGSGVYRRVIESAEWLRRIGFKGDLIARMTVSEISDLFLEVNHLLSLGIFDHIHWQLDVIWSDRWRRFDHWCRESYIPGIDRLVSLWIRRAEEGMLLGIAPFQGVMKAIIGGSIGSPPCGSGVNSISILTDGSIVACPIAVDVEWARLGSIFENDWRETVNRIRIGDDCRSCMYFKYCGGRCLYAYKERLWGESGFRSICRLTIHMIKRLMEVKDKILHLIDKGIINIEDLAYPKFNNTVEIIP